MKENWCVQFRSSSNLCPATEGGVHVSHRRIAADDAGHTHAGKDVNGNHGEQPATQKTALAGSNIVLDLSDLRDTEQDLLQETAGVVKTIPEKGVESLKENLGHPRHSKEEPDDGPQQQQEWLPSPLTVVIFGISLHAVDEVRHHIIGVVLLLQVRVLSADQLRLTDLIQVIVHQVHFTERDTLAKDLKGGERYVAVSPQGDPNTAGVWARPHIGFIADTTHTAITTSICPSDHNDIRCSVLLCIC